MEMYADEDSRGGVLEPQGTVEIKFRKPEILKLIERSDKIYAQLKKDLGKKDQLLIAINLLHNKNRISLFIRDWSTLVRRVFKLFGLTEKVYRRIFWCVTLIVLYLQDIGLKVCS